MTVVQYEPYDLKERMLSTERFNSKYVVVVNNPPEYENGDLLGTIFHCLSPISNLSYPHVI